MQHDGTYLLVRNRKDGVEAKLWRWKYRFAGAEKALALAGRTRMSPSPLHGLLGSQARSRCS